MFGIDVCVGGGGGGTNVLRPQVITITSFHLVIPYHLTANVMTATQSRMQAMR